MNKLIPNIFFFFIALFFPVIIFCQPQSREDLNKQKQQIQKEIEAFKNQLIIG